MWLERDKLPVVIQAGQEKKDKVFGLIDQKAALEISPATGCTVIQ